MYRYMRLYILDQFRRDRSLNAQILFDILEASLKILWIASSVKSQ